MVDDSVVETDGERLIAALDALDDELGSGAREDVREAQERLEDLTELTQESLGALLDRD